MIQCEKKKAKVRTYLTCLQVNPRLKIEKNLFALNKNHMVSGRTKTMNLLSSCWFIKSLTDILYS